MGIFWAMTFELMDTYFVGQLLTCRAKLGHTKVRPGESSDRQTSYRFNLDRSDPISQET